MKGVFDESRPVVSVQSTPSVRTAADARTRRRMRDGTGPPLRDALDARWRRRRKVRARARRNLICVARSSRARSSRAFVYIDGARATEDSREGFATDDGRVMMDRSRDADDKVNKASKAAKFVKKGAERGKAYGEADGRKKRFSATFHRCARETRETTERTPTSPRPDARRGMDEWADGREWRLTTRTRDAIQAAHLEART